MDDSLGVVQIARMCHWLQSQGHTPEEILDCIDYIANSKAEENPPEKEKSGARAATNSEAPDTTNR